MAGVCADCRWHLFGGYIIDVNNVHLSAYLGCNQANASRLRVAPRGFLNKLMMLSHTEVEDLLAKMQKSWIQE